MSLEIPFTKISEVSELIFLNKSVEKKDYGITYTHTCTCIHKYIHRCMWLGKVGKMYICPCPTKWLENEFIKLHKSAVKAKCLLELSFFFYLNNVPVGKTWPASRAGRVCM